MMFGIFKLSISSLYILNTFNKNYILKIFSKYLYRQSKKFKSYEVSKILSNNFNFHKIIKNNNQIKKKPNDVKENEEGCYIDGANSDMDENSSGRCDNEQLQIN
ncbi:hypothetical protein ACTA71_011174 [Dictyostelium dimigraforme]